VLTVTSSPNENPVEIKAVKVSSLAASAAVVFDSNTFVAPLLESNNWWSSVASLFFIHVQSG